MFRREIPWVEVPLRSAATRASANLPASPGGTPTATAMSRTCPRTSAASQRAGDALSGGMVLRCAASPLCAPVELRHHELAVAERLGRREAAARRAQRQRKQLLTGL